MENNSLVQTHLISTGAMQSNFEWSPLDTINTTTYNFNNNIIYNYNPHQSLNSILTSNPNNASDMNGLNDLIDSNFEFDFNFCNYLNQDLTLPIIENQDQKNDEIYKLEIDDSLKNVLSEIESISSEFIDDTMSRSPSESSLLDQVIMSPSIIGDSECPTSSNELIINEDKNLKRVKSGKISKKESNKNAAIRYRVKKTKERDQLFQECDLYERKNIELKEKINAIEQEIDFIKNLLIQAINARK